MQVSPLNPAHPVPHTHAVLLLLDDGENAFAGQLRHAARATALGCPEYVFSGHAVHAAVPLATL